MRNDRVFDNDDIVKNQNQRTKWKMKIMNNEKKKFEKKMRWKKTKTKRIKY